MVMPYLTVTQTGVNSPVIENKGSSVAGPLRKSVARRSPDPGQWPWGLKELPRSERAQFSDSFSISKTIEIDYVKM